MGLKTCNKCKKSNLDWDKIFHTKTGKWKLENHKRADGKWCNKPPEELMMRKKSDVIVCQLCIDSNFGLCLKENMQDHMDNFHADGSSLTDLDYKIMNGMNNMYLRWWHNDPHYYKYKHLEK